WKRARPLPSIAPSSVPRPKYWSRVRRAGVPGGVPARRRSSRPQCSQPTTLAPVTSCACAFRKPRRIPWWGAPPEPGVLSASTLTHPPPFAEACPELLTLCFLLRREDFGQGSLSFQERDRAR